jgi:predicted acyl esterase
MTPRESPEASPNGVTRRGFAATLVGAAGWLVLPRGIARHAEEPAPEYSLLSDVMVTMRDGVRLATDVYVPTGAGSASSGKYPVILERTPYNKTAPSRSERTPANPTPLGRADVAAFFARHGYVVVYQDCRGRYKSEGEFVKYLSDGNDGFDTCAWITKQPWCNGRIATMGYHTPRTPRAR